MSIWKTLGVLYRIFGGSSNEKTAKPDASPGSEKANSGDQPETTPPQADIETTEQTSTPTGGNQPVETPAAQTSSETSVPHTAPSNVDSQLPPELQEAPAEEPAMANGPSPQPATVPPAQPAPPGNLQDEEAAVGGPEAPEAPTDAAPAFAAGLTEQGIANALAIIDGGVGMEELRAVIAVEIGRKGAGFWENRSPTILFERHQFHKRTGGAHSAGNPDISNARPRGYAPPGNRRYQRLARAAALDQQAALESASWGVGQVMGFNAEWLGYGSVDDFVARMRRSEDDQIEAMARYIKERGLNDALRRHDWHKFAHAYNGPNYRRNRYHKKLENAYRGISQGDSETDWQLREAQLYLSYLGLYPYNLLDGIWGAETAAALSNLLEDLQANYPNLLPAPYPSVDFDQVETIPDWLFAALRARIAMLPAPNAANMELPEITEGGAAPQPPSPSPAPAPIPPAVPAQGEPRVVAVSKLNVRSQPNGTLIGELYWGQPVTLLGLSDNPKWAQIRLELNGLEREAYVWAAFLREQVSDSREALVNAAVTEWLRFDRGAGKEHLDPYAGYVGEMWQAINLNYDGRTRNKPWSAAAISFIVRNSGNAFPNYGNFHFAPAHATYIRDAISKRRAQDTTAPFWGFRLDEQKPEIGDMVAVWRKRPQTFDGAEAANGYFPSHCDIIVQIDDHSVTALGGNVSHSLSDTEYDLDGDGYLRPTKRVFGLLANMT